jgi:hypothetical protein
LDSLEAAMMSGPLLDRKLLDIVNGIEHARVILNIFLDITEPQDNAEHGALVDHADDARLALQAAADFVHELRLASHADGCLAALVGNLMGNTP